MSDSSTQSSKSLSFTIPLSAAPNEHNPLVTELLAIIEAKETGIILSETVDALKALALFFDNLSEEGKLSETFNHVDAKGIIGIHRALACRLQQADPFDKDGL